MKQPLNGVRVLDFTMFMAGPYATRLMADAGAEIIKVEPPGGDYMRGTAPNYGGDSRQFAQLNCGKKCISLNLKDPDDMAAAKKLVSEVDVVTENFRPGVMARLGLGYDVLQELNPKIILCSVSGYGQTGPSALRPAFAPVVHAASGYDLTLKEWDKSLEKPPANCSTVADILAATHAYGAIVTALFARDNGSGSEHIDVTLIDSMRHALLFEFQAAQTDDDHPRIIFEAIHAKDGFLMIAPVGPANYAALIRTIGADWMLDDDRFADTQSRARHWSVMLAEAESWALNHSAAEASRLLEAEGCPATPYFTPREMIDDLHNAARGSDVAMRDGGGDFLVPNTPFRFSSGTVGAAHWVAAYGEHNQEYLKRD